MAQIAFLEGGGRFKGAVASKTGTSGVIVLNDQGGDSIGVEAGDISPTLRAETHGNLPVVCAGFSGGQGAKASGIGYADDLSPTIKGAASGSNQVPCALAVHQNQCGEVRTGEVANTINTNGNASGRNAPLVAIGYTPTSFAQYAEGVGTLKANGGDLGGGSETLVTTFARQSNCEHRESDKGSTMQSRDYKSETDLVSNGNAVRRLTPTECERLQGFPEIAELEGEMTKDEYIALNLANGNITSDGATGKIYASRGPGGKAMETPIEVKGTWLNGYRVVSIRNGQTKLQCRVHRIVWIAENGILPVGYIIDHINGNKQDNRLCNLQLLTPAENSSKAASDGAYLCGEDNPQTKISRGEHKAILHLHSTGEYTMRELASKYGISKSRIHQIIKINGWTEYGHDGKKISDTQRYKALGNSVAIPCVEFIMRNIRGVMC